MPDSSVMSVMIARKTCTCSHAHRLLLLPCYAPCLPSSPAAQIVKSEEKSKVKNFRNSTFVLAELFFGLELALCI